MDILTNPTQFLFFTGKGGVGKTSLSCSTAIALADQGNKVLLVCTDPASNLNEVLGCTIGDAVTDIPEVPLLTALNINPEEAAAKYRNRVIEPYRGKLPDSALRSMEEQLSGACTMEIAAFDEFVSLLGDEQNVHEYDYLVFDTAPTGHTLRLLQLPSAWDGFIETNTTGTSCLGPLAGLTQQHELYKNSIESLTHPEKTTIILVCRPDNESIKEASRTSHELRALGLQKQKLLINGHLVQCSDDPIAETWRNREISALQSMPPHLAKLSQNVIPLLPNSPLGPENLRLLWQAAQGTPITPSKNSCTKILEFPPPVTMLFKNLSKTENGVIMTMGKGGVGKTSIATALAKYLSDKGAQVLLATTDPASHLDLNLDTYSDNLAVKCINPQEATRRYQLKVMAEAGSSLDDQGKKLLEEDLRSPCTEEIAVFQEFASLVEEGEDKYVVLDTAPTGHTLLLLDAARSYHREVERTAQTLPASVQKLLPRMRDPLFTRILILTLPNLTPITEAQQLEKDLQRAGIMPYGWIINQSLLPLDITDPILKAKQTEEIAYIEKLQHTHQEKIFLNGWSIDYAFIQ